MRYKILILFFLLISHFICLPSYAEVCRFGIAPEQKEKNPNKLRKMHKPLLDWLSEQTGCRFVPINAKDYEDLINKLSKGVVHIAEMGAVSYVQAKRKNPQIELLLATLQEKPDGSGLADAYQGYIFTLKKYSNINSLNDLKGGAFGFVNFNSSSGFQYPNALLIEHGIHYENFFSETHFLGSHPNVSDAVAAGSIIAGATWQYNYADAVKKHGDIFKVLAKTPPIPTRAVAFHPNLPESFRGKIKQALLNVPRELVKDLSALGYVERPDSFYDSTRQIVKE